MIILDIDLFWQIVTLNNVSLRHNNDIMLILMNFSFNCQKKRTVKTCMFVCVLITYYKRLNNQICE